ncbi:MAG: aminopeptidase P family protein [Eggerthellaceae bacterium]|nr:aminopeptidase P family protein [Eggerthellaceae bacterium]
MPAPEPEPESRPESQIAFAADPALEPPSAPEPEAASATTRKPAHEAPPIDYTAAFAGSVAAVDAGLLSFERQAVVRNALNRIGVASLLVRDTSNVQWITALDDVFDEERAHGLLVAGGRAFLHTDSRYANAVRAGASRIGSDIVVNEERVSHAQFAYNVLTQNGTAPIVGKLGIEDTITYAEFVKMVERFKTEALAPTSEVVLGLRAVKDAGEITRLKAAQAVTDAAFAHIVKFMRPGMTEREVQLELEDFMVRHGAQGLAFRSIVATGENGADPHAVPGRARLEAGQCVVLDFGAKAYGYCSDMTRTVFLGRPQGIMAAAWETVRRANEAVEAMLKPGVTGAAAHELAERVLEEGGFGGKMGHGLGHGVGLDVHELPTLNPRYKKPLVAGNVVTVEPGIYLPGKFGMRLEDFGVITNTGYEVFTQSTHEMVII